MHPLTLAFRESLVSTNLPLEPVDMAFIRGFIPQVMESFQASARDLKSDSHSYARTLGIPKTSANHIGLNTIGMLGDRLSILVVKQYFAKTTEQKESTGMQISDIESAIAASCPGSSSAFNKITTIHTNNLPDNFTGSVMKLGATNLLLWMAQDVLYLRGPDALPEQELREYITFFAEQNVIRNRLIALSDYHYWI